MPNESEFWGTKKGRSRILAIIAKHAMMRSMTGTLKDRVRQVVEASPLNNAQFAEAIGIDGPKLTKSLSGTRRFTSLELARIAETSGESVDWLLTGNMRAHVFAHRSVPSAIEEGDEVGRSAIGLIADRIDGLTAIGRPLNLPELPEPVTSGMAVVQGRRTAQKYLEVLGQSVRSLSTRDLIDLVESTFGVNVVVTALPDGCDGLAYSSGDVRAIVVTSTSPAFRQRFTLAHELGHVAFSDASDRVIEEEIFTTRDLSEMRAGAFAAHFLAPLEDVREVIAARDAVEAFDDLVLDFQLSPKSMYWHLVNAGLVVREAFDAPVFSAEVVALRKGRAAEQAERAEAAMQHRPAWRLVREYLNAYAEGETTLKPAASLLGWSNERTEQFFAEDQTLEYIGE